MREAAIAAAMIENTIECGDGATLNVQRHHLNKRCRA
jgi:hypothetical protein